MRALWHHVANLFLIVAMCGQGGSCSQPGYFAREDLTITVELPALPEVYSPMTVAWQIAWWDGVQVQTVMLEQQRAADSAGATLPLSRQGAEVVVVQATAHPVSGGILSPLGTWTAPPQTRLLPEPEFGRAAEAVLHLARRGLDPALVNLDRLFRTVVAECESRPEDLDQERLVAALGSGEMNRYAIRRRARPGCEVSVAVPDSDVWISHDLTEETIEGVWADDRCYWIVPVARGEVRHLWQGHGGPPGSPVRLLTVGRDRSGHAFWFISLPR